MTLHDAFGWLAVLLAGVCLLSRITTPGGNTMPSKKTPFDAGAAYAAKLATTGGEITFVVGGAEFSMPTAKKFTEQSLRDFLAKSAFDNLRDGLGDDGFAKLEEAAKKANPDGGLTWGMAVEIVNHFMQESGFGGRPE